MANGFATTEELAGKAGVLVSHEGTAESPSLRDPSRTGLHRPGGRPSGRGDPRSAIGLNVPVASCVCFSSYQKSGRQVVPAAVPPPGRLAGQSHCSGPEDRRRSRVPANATAQQPGGVKVDGPPLTTFCRPYVVGKRTGVCV